MTGLIDLDVGRFDAWAELVAETPPGELDGAGFGPQFRPIGTAEFYRAWVDRLVGADDPRPGNAPDRVRCRYFWIVDDAGALVGHLALRRSLERPLLREIGGHIGYSVRPSRRREGHARAALRLALGRAAALGIPRVLITCDEANLPSAATIESCGGALEDVRHGYRRYWLATD